MQGAEAALQYVERVSCLTTTHTVHRTSQMHISNVRHCRTRAKCPIAGYSASAAGCPIRSYFNWSPHRSGCTGPTQLYWYQPSTQQKALSIRDFYALHHFKMSGCISQKESAIMSTCCNTTTETCRSTGVPFALSLTTCACLCLVMTVPFLNCSGRVW